MKLRIEQDDMDHSSPRDWDNMGTMVCFHKSYVLGDKDHGYDPSEYDGWSEMAAAIQKDEDLAVILPLYLYDHSGISMSVGRFDCHWDSGQVGFIFVSKKKVREEYGKKRLSQKILELVENALIGEVGTYDQYLTGDVWGYVIEDDEGNHLDSCWGFYGRDTCEEEAKSVMETLEKEVQESAANLKRVQAAMPCCQP